MPSTMTHTYFSIDIYNKIPSKYKKNITNLGELNLFSQGTDPFMFYNLFIGKNAKKYSKIQSICHFTKTQDFFLEIIHYISKNSLANNKEVLTYLYGNICHYYLDCYAHPFIFYKTGLYNKHEKNTYKYNVMHQVMEYGIDRYLIKSRENCPVKDFPIHQKIFKYYPFSDELKKLIDSTFSKVYNIDNVSSIYIKSIKDMKLFFRIANYDKFGIKRTLYNIIDKISSDKVINISELSYNNQDLDISYLNLDKKNWNHPTNLDETYNYSFFDLYDMALEKALQTIILVSDILTSNNIDYDKLKEIFDNSSYATGKNCHSKAKIKFFEY